MELNKRKSLLTPASPTVWGMIYGEICRQQDIVDMISDTISDNTYTKAEVDDMLANIDVDADTSQFAKKTELDNVLASAYSYTASEVMRFYQGAIDYVDSQIGEINTITEDILG